MFLLTLSSSEGGAFHNTNSVLGLMDKLLTPPSFFSILSKNDFSLVFRYNLREAEVFKEFPYVYVLSKAYSFLKPLGSQASLLPCVFPKIFRLINVDSF